MLISCPLHTESNMTVKNYGIQDGFFFFKVNFVHKQRQFLLFYARFMSSCHKSIIFCHLRCVRYTMFSRLLTAKGNNFCDFLFASLEN